MISYRFNFFCLQVQYFNSFRFNFCLLLFPRLSIPSSPGSIFHLLQVQFFIISRFNIPCFLSLIFHVLHVQYSMLSRFNILFSPGSVFHVLQVQYSMFSRFNIPGVPALQKPSFYEDLAPHLGSVSEYFYEII